MQRLQRLGWVSIAIFLACGGDDKGAPAGSGVDGSIVLSELSETQRTAVCQASVRRGFANPMIDEGCTLEASYETESLAECKDYKAECVTEVKQQLASLRQDALDDCEDLDGSEYLNCDYTVEEYERCDSESIKGWERAAREASCLNAGTFEDDEDYPYELSVDCEDVLDSCYIE